MTFTAHQGLACLVVLACVGLGCNQRPAPRASDASGVDTGPIDSTTPDASGRDERGGDDAAAGAGGDSGSDAAIDAGAVTDASGGVDSRGDTADTTALRILSVSPATDIHVGDVVTVTGANLGLNEGTTQVTIGGTAVTAIISGDDTHLVFRVPPLPGLPAAGTVLTLRITNQTTADSVDRLFLPAPNTLTGPVIIEYLGGMPAPLSAAPLFFRYRLTSVASADAAFAVTASVSIAGWPATVLDASQQQPVPPAGVLLAVGVPVDVVVRVDATGAAAGQVFTLGVTAASGIAGGTSGLQVLTLGTDAPAPDPGVRLQFISFSLTGGATLADDTITAGAGGAVRLSFDARFTTPAHYVAAATLEGAAASGWTASITGPLPEGIDAGDASPHPVSVVVAATPDGGATPGDGMVRLTITNADTGAAVQSVLFALRGI
jgi:hypothetical protein